MLFPDGIEGQDLDFAQASCQNGHGRSKVASVRGTCSTSKSDIKSFNIHQSQFQSRLLSARPKTHIMESPLILEEASVKTKSSKIRGLASSF